MKILQFTLVAALVCSGITMAQTELDKKEVEAALLDYIEGFYEGDSAKIVRSISPDVTKYGYWKDKNSGQYGGEPMSYKEMIDYAVRVKKTNRMRTNDVKEVSLLEVQEQIACGKVRAWWGIDYALLEKIDGKWKIRMVLWQGPLPG